MRLSFLRVALLVAGLVVPCASVIRGSASETLAEDARYRVRLVSEAPAGAQYHTRTFGIYRKDVGREALVTTTNLIAKVEAVRIVGDRLLVFGSDQFAIGVAVVHLQRGQELDFIYCYWPELSSTGRYLIYTKFYPRGGMAEERSDLVLVYDLERSPEENRVDERIRAILRAGRNRAHDPEYLAVVEDAGVPVYPPENAAKQSYFVWERIPELRHLVLGGRGSAARFLWRNQDTEVVFVDRHAEENWVVAVDLAGGAHQARSRVAKIDVASIVAFPPGTPDYARRLREAKERFAVKALADVGGGRIVLSFWPDPHLYQGSEITVNLP